MNYLIIVLIFLLYPNVSIGGCTDRTDVLYRAETGISNSQYSQSDFENDSGQTIFAGFNVGCSMSDNYSIQNSLIYRPFLSTPISGSSGNISNITLHVSLERKMLQFSIFKPFVSVGLGVARNSIGQSRVVDEKFKVADIKMSGENRYYLSFQAQLLTMLPKYHSINTFAGVRIVNAGKTRYTSLSMFGEPTNSNAQFPVPISGNLWLHELFIGFEI